MMKLILQFFNRFKYLIYNSSIFLLNHKIYLLLFFSACLYRFFDMALLNIFEDRGRASIIIFLVTFLASLAVSLYVFKQNKNSDTKLMQYIKLIIFNFLLGLSILVISLFVIYYFELYTAIENSSHTNWPKVDSFEISKGSGSTDVASVGVETQGKKDTYNVKLDKDSTDKMFKEGLKIITDIGTTAVKSIGGASVGGAIGAAIVNNTGGMPLGPRAGLTIGGAFLGTAAGVVGMEVGHAVSAQAGIKDMIKDSKHSNPEPDNIPSPGDTHIHSMIENGELNSPLEVLLLSQFKINILILLVILMLLCLIAYTYTGDTLKSKFAEIIKRKLPDNLIIWYEKYTSVSFELNKKIIITLFIVYGLLLISLLFLNIYVSAELAFNIDDYIEGHKFVYKKS